MFCWAQHQDGGLKTAHHTAVAAGDRVYSFGGSAEKTINIYTQMDVHVFNPVSLRWLELPPVINSRGKRPVEVPPKLHSHTAVLIENTVYIWGGVPYRDVLYTFDVDSHRWFKPKVSGSVPEGRDKHSACVLEKVMYIYGGWTLLSYYANYIWKLDTSAMVWSLINARGTPPPGSSHHSATVIGTKMFVFGGLPHLGDHIGVFDMESDRWLSLVSAQPRPEGRSGHSAFAHNGRLYVFGGDNRGQTRGYLWTFDPDSLSWRKVETKGKVPRLTPSMCCCMVGNRIILFGGFKMRYQRSVGRGRQVFDMPSNDLYILDLSPSLKMLCKLVVIQNNLEQDGLPHNIRWELVAMTTNRNGV